MRGKVEETEGQSAPKERWV